MIGAVVFPLSVQKNVSMLRYFNLLCVIVIGYVVILAII